MTSSNLTEQIISAAKNEGRTLLTEVESKNLLMAEGITVTDAHLATDADEAAAAAEKVGFPTVMKIISPDIAHKSDVGGVVVGLADGRSYVGWASMTGVGVAGCVVWNYNGFFIR